MPRGDHLVGSEFAATIRQPWAFLDGSAVVPGTPGDVIVDLAPATTLDEIETAFARQRQQMRTRQMWAQNVLRSSP